MGAQPRTLASRTGFEPVLPTSKGYDQCPPAGGMPKLVVRPRACASASPRKPAVGVRGGAGTTTARTTNTDRQTKSWLIQLSLDPLENVWSEEIFDVPRRERIQLGPFRVKVRCVRFDVLQRLSKHLLRRPVGIFSVAAHGTI
jgi:hypothetical protein